MDRVYMVRAWFAGVSDVMTVSTDFTVANVMFVDLLECDDCERITIEEWIGGEFRRYCQDFRDF